MYLIGLDVPVIREKAIAGAGRRKAGCYQCHSTDRERLVYVYLRHHLNMLGNRHAKILHLAPEKSLSKALSKIGYNSYICGDFFTEGYDYPSHVEQMDILNLPFPNNYFDLIIANHILEHIPEDHKAMTEIHRALKVGGKAILQVPVSQNSVETYEDFTITDPEVRELAFGQFDHVRIYGKDYQERLRSAGFGVAIYRLAQEYPKYGLSAVEELYVGEK